MPSTPTDFDFFLGDWQVHHRRLNSRLTGCTDWTEFTGETSVRKLLGGMGNMDDNLLHLPEGSYRAVTLRAFDPATGTWSIWWLDGRHPGRLDTPVVGRFDGHRGEFLAEDSLNGQAIRVRFTWLAEPGANPRWAQAFSADDGASWEENWTMEFSRRAAD
jgi:hypothetical protein